jgi:hypothetical protein
MSQRPAGRGLPALPFSAACKCDYFLGLSEHFSFVVAAATLAAKDAASSRKFGGDWRQDAAFTGRLEARRHFFRHARIHGIAIRKRLVTPDADSYWVMMARFRPGSVVVWTEPSAKPTFPVK